MISNENPAIYRVRVKFYTHDTRRTRIIVRASQTLFTVGLCLNNRYLGSFVDVRRTMNTLFKDVYNVAKLIKGSPGEGNILLWINGSRRISRRRSQVLGALNKKK